MKMIEITIRVNIDFYKGLKDLEIIKMDSRVDQMDQMDQMDQLDQMDQEIWMVQEIKVLDQNPQYMKQRNLFVQLAILIARDVQLRKIIVLPAQRVKWFQKEIEHAAIAKITNTNWLIN